MKARNSHIEMLNFIKKQAKEAVEKDNYYCPVFYGALNSIHEKIYEYHYRKEFLRRLEDEQ